MGDLKGENGDPVTKDIDKAEQLNTFFASVLTSENDIYWTKTTFWMT